MTTENQPDTQASMSAALARIVREFAADSGTIHFLGADRQLHLEAASQGIPESVLAIIRTIPVGKGMAGLAVERAEPVNACNIQTDASGDVRPGAKATGLAGSIVVPIFDRAGGVFGVLDVDSDRVDDFSQVDAEGLQKIVRLIENLL